MNESRTAPYANARIDEPLPVLGGSEVSLMELTSLMFLHRWRVALWMLVAGVVVALPPLLSPRRYTSTASFVLQGTDQNRAGLSGLAGQLGLQLSAGGSLSQSPQFYADLLRTRELLGRVADDSFRVEPKGGRPVPFVDLFEIKGKSPATRRESAIRRLNPSMVNVRVSKSTGIIGVDVSTPWPAVSQAIVVDLLEGVNRFSLVMRQSQAAAERKFSEERVEDSRAALRVAEDRLAGFLRANRQYENSPELSFAHERLQREVSLQQQVFMSVVQGFEEARSREARNTPVITVVDSASFPIYPDSRGTLPRFIVGALVGAMLYFIVLLVRHSLQPAGVREPKVGRRSSTQPEGKRDYAPRMPGDDSRAREGGTEAAKGVDG
jgi:uncharacterized protein involved in exopolysaccharide biosynthesis